jgi:hypothetical protein
MAAWMVFGWLSEGWGRGSIRQRVAGYGEVWMEIFKKKGL